MLYTYKKNRNNYFSPRFHLSFPPILTSRGFFIQILYLYNMERPNNEKKKIINMAMGPRLRRILYSLSQENEYYFDLTEEERYIVANRLKILVVDEIIKILNGIDKQNIKFIMEIGVENLTIMRTFFEEMEMYSQCLMMNDAIKQLENDIQELASVKL